MQCSSPCGDVIDAVSSKTRQEAVVAMAIHTAHCPAVWPVGEELEGGAALIGWLKGIQHVNTRLNLIMHTHTDTRHTHTQTLTYSNSTH